MIARAPARPDRGVTLVELMVAGVILSLMVGVVLKLLVLGSTLFSRQSRLSETQLAGRFGLSIIADDAQAAGFGTSPRCDHDPRVIDPSSSCTPFASSAFGATFGVQAIRFVDDAPNDYGAAQAGNPQFQPDEIWFMASPAPGRRLVVASQSAGTLNLVQETTADASTMSLILYWPLLVIERRGVVSVRAGYPSATVTPGAGAGSTWTVTVSPAPAGSQGYGGGETLVGAAAWLRYYLEVDANDPSSTKLNLMRATYGRLDQAPASTDIVAEHVIDLQASFCIDQSYSLTSAPATPVIACGITDASVINAYPERVRTVTVTVRTRDRAEDASVPAESERDLWWYDVDGNLANGVARVRAVTRTIPLSNMAI